MAAIQAFLNYPIVHAALIGAIGAAAADFAAFRSWKSVQEAAAYAWSTAAWRWFQGAVVGAVGQLGLGVIA